jgi:D-amino-acid dehydrogenase
MATGQRIAVIGAGIIGVTTAYELAAEGHEVIVYERHSSVAGETSFANAGVLAPGYVTPWAAPGMPLKVLRQLFGQHAAVRFGGWNALALTPWLWRWWRACALPVHEANRSSLQRLAHFSRQRQLELTQHLSLNYEQAAGYLVLLRGAREMAAAQASGKLLEALGATHQLIDADRARGIEPGLHADTPLAGAIHLPQDGVGNCRQFAHAMKTHAQQRGALFRFEHQVRRIVPGARPTLEFELPRHDGDTLVEPPPPFDAIVVCAGHQSVGLLGALGVRLPIAPVYGYSVTAPLRLLEGHPEMAPRAGLMDEKYKVAITRLGQRIRVAGGAEIGGQLSGHNQAALATLYKVLEDWFPGAAVTSQAQHWKGARPMLPDGPPVIGPSGAAGVWLNLGHGSSGWALACGSARVVADMVAGRTPPIDTQGLAVARLR